VHRRAALIWMTIVVGEVFDDAQRQSFSRVTVGTGFFRKRLFPHTLSIDFSAQKHIETKGFSNAGKAFAGRFL